jgi:hypothetical protein
MSESVNPDWSIAQIFESTSFGKMWVVVRFNGHWMFCARVRRKEHEGMFVRKDQIKKFKRQYDLNIGDMLFQDTNNLFQLLRPDETMMKQISRALEDL